MNEGIEKRVCFTGHRTLGRDFSKRKAYQLMQQLYEKGVDTFICGGTIGFDMEIAYLVLELQIEHPEVQLWLFLPCNNYDAKWDMRDKNRMKTLLKYASYIDCPDTPYHDGVMKARNYKMVDNSLYCVSYFNGKRVSGTAQTIRYAKRSGRQIFNLCDKGMAVVETL